MGWPSSPFKAIRATIGISGSPARTNKDRMEETMIATQSELKALFDDQAEAIRTKDN
jgi:hypothetical protein